MPGAVMERLQGLYDLGGPVVAILVLMSVLTLAVTLFKLWQFRSLRVGRHRHLQEALAAWDGGDRAGATRALSGSSSHLRPVVQGGMTALEGGADAAALAPRLYAEASARLTRLEGGFRVLDVIAQLAPLLGLFGTVLGMIDAFQALQGAGASVDPSILAGGIWVALMTTAVGLAVAMPTSVILSWLEARVAGERALADRALQTVLRPGLPMRDSTTDVQARAA
ncbi:MotA/TolQ/ExbB proton channel family protein [Pseudoroseicyclus aestuarii]|uniref:Outer membrane transport energization protein ExbB n=1 Tax=Pseudoroseicyclus aestuarii TaxID=1795041 RepID=A0A318SU41_9RHOB|nr:MotA/TolQ/ExbB proton channel family protein [Pseudoroseicyclus aestuarii]PYE84875.1 outer membrane transport energization protein ExbB [Pseudoroseicyclus aestuarii]